MERWRNDGKNWETTYGVSDWKPTSWRNSYGIQIYTGKPSRDLSSLDFEYEIIRDHPQLFLDTLTRLCALTENPLRYLVLLPFRLRVSIRRTFRHTRTRHECLNIPFRFGMFSCRDDFSECLKVFCPLEIGACEPGCPFRPAADRLSTKVKCDCPSPSRRS